TSSTSRSRSARISATSACLMINTVSPQRQRSPPRRSSGGNVAEVPEHPVVGVDGVEVAVTAVGEDDHAVGPGRQVPHHLPHSGEGGAGGTAGENPLPGDELAAGDHTVQIGHM